MNGVRSSFKFKRKRVMAFVMALLMVASIVSPISGFGSSSRKVKAAGGDLASIATMDANRTEFYATSAETDQVITLAQAPTLNNIKYGACGGSLYWDFPEDSAGFVHPAAEDVYTCALPSNIVFNTSSGNITEVVDGETKIYGTYSISGSALTVQYNGADADYLWNRTNRYSKVDFTGTITKDATGGVNGGAASFYFPSNIQYNTKLASNSSVSVEKSVSAVTTDANGQSYATYTIIVSSEGENNNVALNDVAKSLLSIDTSSIKVYSDSNKTSELSGASISNQSANGFDLSIPTMTDGQKAYVVYSAKIDNKAYVETGLAGNQATVTSSEDTTGDTDNVTPSFPNRNWVDKSHEDIITDNGDGTYTVTWSVNVNNNDTKLDIGGSVLKDELPTGVTAPTSITVTEAEAGSNAYSPSSLGITAGEIFGEGYTFPAGSTKKYKIVYSTVISNPSPLAKNEFKNIARLYRFGKDVDRYYEPRQESAVWVGPDINFVQKSCNTSANSSTVDWTVTVKVPEVSSPITSYVLKDSIPNGMTLDASSWSVNYGSAITHTKTPETPADGSTSFVLDFGDVSATTESTITINYKTVITTPPTSGTETYTNKAVLNFDGDTYVPEDKRTGTAEYKYENVSYLKKNTDYDGALTNNGKNRWSLTLSNIKPDATSVVIKDTLPEFMSLDQSSFKYWDNLNKNNSVSVNPTISNADGKFTLTFTGADIAKLSNGLFITYETYVSDAQGAYMTTQGTSAGTAWTAFWKEYTNTASISIDDEVVDQAIAKQQIQTHPALRKTGDFDSTNNTASYSVVVNEDAVDLVGNADSYSLIDTLPEKFIVTGDVILDGTKLTKGTGYTYDQATNKLTIKNVSDNTKHTLTYSALVTLPEGTILDSSNSVNTISIEGKADTNSSSATSVDGVVHKSSGQGGARVGLKITITKKDKQNVTALSGAEFTLYQMTYDNGTVTVDSTAAPVVKTTDANGKCSFSGLKTLTIYKVVETKAPVGYAIDSTPKFITYRLTSDTDPYDGVTKVTEGNTSYDLNKSTSDTEEYEYSYTQIDNPLAVTLKKVDKATSLAITNTEATFALYSGDDLVQDNLKTGSDGTLQLGQYLRAGQSYSLKETKAPEGYKLAEEVKFSVNENGAIVTGEDDDSVIDVTKSSEDDNEIVIKDEEIILDGKFLPTASKTVDGETPTVDGFKFSLYSLTSATDTVGTKVATGTSKAGNIAFSPLAGVNDFSAADGFKYSYGANSTYPIKKYYKVVEDAIPANLVGYTKDSSSYVIEVTLNKNASGDALLATTSIKKDGQSVNGVVFNNTTTELTGSYKPVVSKTVGGLTPTDDGFKFTLEQLASATATSGTVIAKGTSAGGIVTFAPAPLTTAYTSANGITFTANSTDTFPQYYYYQITEDDVPASLSLYKKDAAKYLIKVTVNRGNGETLAVSSEIQRDGLTYNKSTMNFDNEKKVASLTVNKTVKGLKDVNEAADNITIEVKDEDGNLVDSHTYTADDYKNAVCTFTTDKVEPGKVYTVTETATDIEGYDLYSTMYKVGTASGNGKTATITIGTVEGENTVDFTNTYRAKTTSFNLKKVDANDSTKALQGAKFNLVDATDATVYNKNAGTDANGMLTFTGLAYGSKYTLTETTAPEGYKLSDSASWTVTVSKKGEVKVGDTVVTANAPFEVSNAPKTLTISKRDATNVEELPGAELTLTNPKGQKFSWTSGQNATTITSNDSFKLVDGVYTLVEDTEPAGYKAITTTTFEITDGKVVASTISNTTEVETDANGTLLVNDQPIKQTLSFTKSVLVNELCSTNADYSATEEKALTGVTFTLTKNGSNVSLVATSDANGKVTFADLRIGTYTLQETLAPANIVLPTATYTVTVTATGCTMKNADGESVTNITNDVKRADIQLLKVNESDPSAKLPNSRYGLYRKMVRTATGSGVTTDDAVKIAEATTDANGMLTFKGVLLNTEYVVKEEAAPDGYYVSEDPITVEFETNANGQVVLKAANGSNGTAEVDIVSGAITWKEPVVTYQFTKTDEKDQPLAGAELELQDENGNVIDSWTSTSQAHVVTGLLNCGKTYKLVEKKAPAGYEVAKSITFTVDKTMAANQGFVGSVSMVDKKKTSTTETTSETTEATTVTTTQATTQISTSVTTETTTSTTTTSTTTTTETKTTTKKTAKTGDNSPIAILLSMMCLACAGIFVLSDKKKKLNK